MKSERCKVLHEVCGKPMAAWVCDAAEKAGAERTVLIVGHKKEDVCTYFGEGFSYAVQEQPGTGYAVSQVLSGMSGTVAVLWGDMPLLTADTVQSAVTFHQQSENAVTVCGNGGICCFEAEQIPDVQAGTSLEELIAAMRGAGVHVGEFEPGSAKDLLDVNDCASLAQAEAMMRSRINNRLMKAGVTFIDPSTAYIDAAAQIAPDAVIEPNVIIRGATVIGAGSVIGTGTTIERSSIAQNVHIRNSVILDSEIGAGTTVGPFAYIRPGSHIGETVKIGDFVEIKNSHIGDGTKVSHLTYIGDSDVGRGINFGCGTITVNYDGEKKFRTVIEDNAFIGCNTNLVAPVTVHENAFIAAGSTITDDVEANALAIARSRQTVKQNWRKNK